MGVFVAEACCYRVSQSCLIDWKRCVRTKVRAKEFKLTRLDMRADRRVARDLDLEEEPPDVMGVLPSGEHFLRCYGK